MLKHKKYYIFNSHKKALNVNDNKTINYSLEAAECD